MGRLYSVTFSAVAVTAQQDLFSIAPATNKPVKIHGVFLGQSSDAGDAQDELLQIAVIRGHTSVGSGGSGQTPAPQLAASISAGFGARVNDTTIASGGTTVTLHSDAFNVRVGYPLLLTPETYWHCTAASSRIVVRLLTTPADALTMSGTLLVEEPF